MVAFKALHEKASVAGEHVSPTVLLISNHDKDRPDDNILLPVEPDSFNAQPKAPAVVRPTAHDSRRLRLGVKRTEVSFLTRCGISAQLTREMRFWLGGASADVLRQVE